jgi:hypothetical protein
VIHVYAITDAEGSAPDLLGIDDRPLELRTAGAAAALMSRHDVTPEPTAEALLRHAAVVEAWHAHRAVLPARFGAGVPDEPAVDALLAENGLTARLDRVRNRVEVDVRLVVAEAGASGAPAGGGSGSGREHLRALATQAAAVEAARARLEEQAVAVADRPPGSSRVLRHAALLLDRTALDAFGRVVADVAAELAPAHTVLCTGPWPPYNFVAAA